MSERYYELRVTSADPDTEIWLGDEEGHLVQKETGHLRTRLLPGLYAVHFGLRGERRWVALNKDVELREGEAGRA